MEENKKKKVKNEKHGSLSWQEQEQRKISIFPLCLNSEPNTSSGMMINFESIA